MSGFANALGGFMTGFGTGRDIKQARIDRKERNALNERYVAALERMPQNAALGPMPLGVGGGAGGGGSPGGMGRPGQPVAGPQGANLLGLIDKTEGAGNYDTLFGHSQNGGRFDGVRVSEKTIGQLFDFSNPSGEYGQWVKESVGRVATPMGRYQIVGTTLRNAAAEMGLSPDTKFTPQTQDAIAAHLARRRLASARSPAAKRAAMRAEWEGFKHVSDEALDAAIAQFEANGSTLNPRAMGVVGPR